MAEPTIRKLGVFLADLTQDKPPDQIHQEILERLRDPDQELDHRLAGIYLHVKDFVPIWTAIRNGVSLPAASWETVILPVVVHFSSPHTLKSHLESVTSLFLNARGGREIEADSMPVAGYEPERLSLLDSVFGKVDEEPAPQAPPPPPPPPLRPVPVPVAARRTGRRWVPQTAAVAIIAVAGVAIWTGGGRIVPGGNSFAALPERPSVVAPSPDPSASPGPDPQVSGSPVPSSGPTTGAPGAHPPQPGQPSRIPGAPTSLASTSVDRNSVSLSWRPPTDIVNVAYYKIFQDGFVIGQPTGTSDDAVNLRPATTYTFVVRAYNQVGQESPPSNSLTVTTTTPAIVFDVPSTVSFGYSFSVGGSGWPCRDVKIYLGGNAVELGKVDEYSSFDAQIRVHDQQGEPGFVDFLSGGGSMRLIPGEWSVTAACPAGPSRSGAITVVDIPMSIPSATANPSP